MGGGGAHHPSTPCPHDIPLKHRVGANWIGGPALAHCMHKLMKYQIVTTASFGLVYVMIYGEGIAMHRWGSWQQEKFGYLTRIENNHELSKH